MKHVTVTLLLALSLTCHAQEQPPLMPSVVPPMDPVNLRLNMAADQMGKAAWSRNTSGWVLLFGGLFTAIASDRSGKYDERLPIGLGAITAAGFVTLTIKGSKHDRRASKLLHQ
jgi:hypothetical protein